jgi:hypothetical protein
MFWQFVGVLLLVGFVGAYFWWTVAAAAVVGLVYYGRRWWRAECQHAAEREAEHAAIVARADQQHVWLTPSGQAINARHNWIVTIGLCAGIPLEDGADTWRHGAVFLLRDNPRMDAEVTLDGWTTTVAKAMKAVITRGPSSATGYGDTHSEALRAACCPSLQMTTTPRRFVIEDCDDHDRSRGWCAPSMCTSSVWSNRWVRDGRRQERKRPQ